jgi:hypothetical protein
LDRELRLAAFPQRRKGPPAIGLSDRLSEVVAWYDNEMG